ncbi:MAG: rhodanese-like domain-containing protein [Anaerovoracaceae bacterium]|jgi:phage shock protein E
MGFLDFIKGKNINDGVQQFSQSDGAVLLDVRTEPEYRGGHIPGSVNVPLEDIAGAPGLVSDKSKPLYVYCFSGARSSRACSLLRRMGYEDVTNIGGIAGYRGKVVRKG